MIFCKSRLVSEDDGKQLFRADVTFKVSVPEMIPNEIQAILESVITNDITDLYMADRIATIMQEEAELLAKHVQDLMEGKDHDSKNTKDVRA